MRALVLLYRKRKDDKVTIKEFPKVKDYNLHYVVGENHWGLKEGILKKFVGQVCETRPDNLSVCGHSLVSRYPIELPYMDFYWGGGYFIFINKKLYDENPIYYYDMIKNYKEG